MVHASAIPQVNFFNRHYLLLSIGLIAGTMLAIIFCATLLDVFIPRPFAASVNTLLPGFTYASVALMKIYLLLGVLLFVMAFVDRRLRFLT